MDQELTKEEIEQRAREIARKTMALPPRRVNQRRGNNTFVGAPLRYDDRQTEFVAFDALPQPLRDMVNETATKLSAVSVQAFVANITRQANDSGTAVAYTMRRLPELEANEISVFAGRYTAETRKPYPFVAAGARIQRYGQRGPSRYPPRRYRLRGLPREVPEAA